MNEPTDYSLRNQAHLCHDVVVPAEYAGFRLDQALARLFPSHSRSRLQSWLKQDLIRIDGQRRDAKFKVWGGEILRVSEPQLNEQGIDMPEAISLRIIYEDESLIVINKPAGLVVHPGNGNRSGTLLNALLHHAPFLAGIPRAGIVHRLDKETSGLMVVAKTLPAQTDLVRQLQSRTVKRHYYALVTGCVGGEKGEVDAPVGRHPVHRTRMAVVASGRAAITRYFVRERFRHATLLECRLETGRTHQIRVHMAHIGHPLVGDPVYGARRVADETLRAFPRQALHAFRLGLRHPDGGTDMSWQAALPDDMETLLDNLRRNESDAV